MLHKKYKDFIEFANFNFSISTKRGNEHNDAKILWTNLSIIIKIILITNKNITSEDYSDSDYSILTFRNFFQLKPVNSEDKWTFKALCWKNSFTSSLITIFSMF